jgi:translin
MEGLDSIGEQMHALLRAKNSARDRALDQSRSVIRFSSLAIRAVHREERVLAEENLRQARTQAKEMQQGLADYPDLYFAGYTQDALKELAEASIVFALVGELPLPGAAELGVDIAPYLNGLGEAERLLGLMDDIYSLLVTLDYPDALTGGLRRTTDMVRGVLERTRGDLTLSLRMEAAERAAAALEQALQKQKP